MRLFTSSSDQSMIHLQSGDTHTDKKEYKANTISWGFFGFLVLIVCAEIFIFRNVLFYGHSPGFIGQLGELEASFQKTEQQKIKVGIWGDSQSIDALLPSLLGQYSQKYDAEQMFNFSISGGSAFDIYKTYLQYKDRLPNLEMAIVVVNEHQFNNEDPANYIMFKYYANLRDRLQVMNKDNYGELLLGWVLKSYDMRSVWQTMFDKYRKGEWEKEVPVHEGGLPPVTWSPSSHRTYDYAVEVAERWFRNYKLEGVRTDAFHKLIQDLSAQGIDTIILQLPRSEYFETAVAERFSEERQAYLDQIASVAETFEVQFEIMSNEGMPIDQFFRDSNHVNANGAAVVSKVIAQKYLSN